jgi:hypothetical protein
MREHPWEEFLLVVGVVHLNNLIALLDVVEQVGVETVHNHQGILEQAQEMVWLILAVPVVVYNFLTQVDQVKLVDQELFLLKKLPFLV